jgi:hypothetical protein
METKTHYYYLELCALNAEFHCSYMYNYYNHYLEPCALNAEFQHFIPRFHKNFLTLRTSLNEGIGGEKRLKGRVKTG